MDSKFDYISRLIEFLPLAHYPGQQIPRFFISSFSPSSYPLFYLFFMFSRLINNSSSCDFGSHSPSD